VKMLRQYTYKEKVLKALTDLIDAHLEVVTGVPDPEERNRNRMVLRYTDQRACSMSEASETGELGKRKRAKIKKDARRRARGEHLMNILNYSWAHTWLLWHVHGPTCPVKGCDGTKKTLKKILRDAMVDMFFGYSLPVPAESKWMDVTELFALFVMMHYVCGLMARAVDLGLSGLRKEAEERGLSTEITEKDSWGQQNQKRARTVCRLFASATCVIRGITLAIAVMPTDRLSGWLLRDTDKAANKKRLNKEYWEPEEQEEGSESAPEGDTRKPNLWRLLRSLNPPAARAAREYRNLVRPTCSE
jgi:hypothetical protein